MKIQRKLMGFVVLCAMLAVFLAGCAETPEPPPEEISTITVVDHLGRTVELQKPAERVIGTHNPSMNMVVVLDGGGSRIAGFGNKDMAYGLYDLVAPEINEVSEIVLGKNINMETLMTVADLVVMPVRFKDQIGNFTEIAYPVLPLT